MLHDPLLALVLECLLLEDIVSFTSTSKAFFVLTYSSQTSESSIAPPIEHLTKQLNRISSETRRCVFSCYAVLPRCVFSINLRLKNRFEAEEADNKAHSTGETFQPVRWELPLVFCFYQSQKLITNNFFNSYSGAGQRLSCVCGWT